VTRLLGTLVIGKLRRECTDHLIVLGEVQLRRALRGYATYYNEDRTHGSLDKGSPAMRTVLSRGSGVVVALPRVSGLHHRYERCVA